jgi:hypothetical protein
VHRLLPLAVTLAAVLPTAACSTPGPLSTPAAPGTCAPLPAAELLPADGIYLGVNLDPARQSLAEAGAAIGHAPAVSVAFTDLPPSAADERVLTRAVQQVRASGGLLLLTAEPYGGLGAVTDDVAADLATRLDGYNRRGVPVVVRFAEEMNGHWYPWGQQPAAYVTAFRRIAAAVHAGAPGSATMWAPAYGGGYPFAPAVAADTALLDTAADTALLDTDGDGTVTAQDDPYGPYWPGEDAVDWAGLSLFHWGDTHPWAENEVPEPGKFLAQLTGDYAGLGGDDRALPDFYATYGEQYGKPVAIAETGAFYAAGAGGAGEVAVKRAWQAQVLDPALRERLPRLAMVNWVEREAREAETGTLVDWRVLDDPRVAAAFRTGLPAWARWAGDVPGCTP